MNPPNTFYLPPTLHSPGSTLPILHYRDVLPHPRTEETATEFLTAHTWEKRVRQQAHHSTPTNHARASGAPSTSAISTPTRTNATVSSTHTIQSSRLTTPGVFQGSSTLLLGAAGGDGDTAGLKLTVHPGDVLVLPAGTAHSSVESKDDYRYVGVYPRVGAVTS